MIKNEREGGEREREQERARAGERESERARERERERASERARERERKGKVEGIEGSRDKDQSLQILKKQYILP